LFKAFYTDYSSTPTSHSFFLKNFLLVMGKMPAVVGMERGVNHCMFEVSVHAEKSFLKRKSGWLE
jgi:hypothetical protein